MTILAATSNGSRAAQTRRQAAGYALLAPMLLLMLFALVAPLAILGGYSFVPDDAPPAFTLENYQTILEKPQYGRVLGRSLLIGVTVALAAVLVTYPAAYYIAFHVHKRKAMWLILITLPFWTSYLLRVFAWKLILGFNGIINSALVWTGLTAEPLAFLLYSPFAVWITLVHAWAAFAILPIYVSLQKIDRSLVEAASDLGESPWGAFWRVTLPLSMPGVTAAFLLVFIPTVGDYVTPKLVGGPNGIMIGSLIQLSVGSLDNWPLGAALSVATMASVAAIVGFGALAWRRAGLRSA